MLILLPLANVKALVNVSSSAFWADVLAGFDYFLVGSYHISSFSLSLLHVTASINIPVLSILDRLDLLDPDDWNTPPLLFIDSHALWVQPHCH